MDYLVVLDITHGSREDAVQQERVETDDTLGRQKPAQGLFHSATQSFLKG